MAVLIVISKAKALLLQGNKLLDGNEEYLNTLLHRLQVQELNMLAQEVRVGLTGSFTKDNIIMGMACIGVLQCETPESDDMGVISYLIEDTKHVLCSLPAFSSVIQ